MTNLSMWSILVDSTHQHHYQRGVTAGVPVNESIIDYLWLVSTFLRVDEDFHALSGFPWSGHTFIF